MKGTQVYTDANLASAENESRNGSLNIFFFFFHTISEAATYSREPRFNLPNQINCHRLHNVHDHLYLALSRERKATNYPCALVIARRQGNPCYYVNKVHVQPFSRRNARKVKGKREERWSDND